MAVDGLMRVGSQYQRMSGKVGAQRISEIVLDGNIFGLQIHGGVSTYAARLYVELTRINRRPKLILPRGLIYNGFGSAEVRVAPTTSREHFPARLTQYLSANAGKRSVIFHSAYYRRPIHRVARYVVTVHDFTYERFRSGPALWMHHRLKTAAILAADAVICISEATRRDTLEFCPSLDPARLHVIRHGVDAETFYSDPTGAPTGMDQIVLFVGQRGGYKRFELAAQALALMPDLELGFVGPAPLPAEVALLNRLIPHRWIWLGRVDNVMLRALYSTAYAFIFPSDYEGFGLPVLEAMACGCPTITSTDAALREVGGSAALVAAEQQPEAYAAALTRLASPSARMELIARGLETAPRFNWRDCARRTLDVFDPERAQH